MTALTNAEYLLSSVALGIDPQVHTHCLVPNVVRRQDGRCVAIAARPMHVWARAAGSVYQAELQRLLSLRLGVEWQPDRSNTREIAGFDRGTLRTFSKRTVEIEAELDAKGATYESPALRMRADDEASLATRPAKDHTPELARLADRHIRVDRAVLHPTEWRQIAEHALALHAASIDQARPITQRDLDIGLEV